MPEQVWMDALGVEPCPCGPPAKDQERACAGERAALGVQEELRPAAAVEVRPAAGEVAAQGLGGRTPDRHDPLLAALAETADEALVERDAALLEADGLRDSQARAVEELDQSSVAEVARLGSRGGLD